MRWGVKQYGLLVVAILAEVVATSALKASNGFRVPWPSVLVVVGYGLSFYCLSLSLRTIPVGVAYAIWSAVGQVLVTVIAWFLYRQTLDFAAILGIAIIIVGVSILTLFSNAVPH
jgi:small multidrug resistance pump